MKYVISFILLLVSSLAFASVSTNNLSEFNNLTDAQKVQILSQITQMKNQNGLTVTSTPEQVQEWVDVGTAVGKGLASAAKELDMALDEFSKSDIGKLAVLLIIWKVIGSSIVHIVFGILWFMVAIPTWIYFFKRLVMCRKETYINTGDKKPTIVVTYDSKDATDGAWIMCGVSGIVIIVVGLVSIFTF